MEQRSGADAVALPLQGGAGLGLRVFALVDAGEVAIG
jgi:hypothetical protein